MHEKGYINSCNTDLTIFSIFNCSNIILNFNTYLNNLVELSYKFKI